jgi:hypothetical protein
MFWQNIYDKDNQTFDLGENNIRIVSEIDFSYAEVFQYNLMITFVKLRNVKYKIWKAATSTISPNLLKLALPFRYSWPCYSLDKTN